MQDLKNNLVMLTDKNQLIMRNMNSNDFQLIRNLCINEGWNIGLYDKDAYYQTDTTGHKIFSLNNTTVGSISLVKHNKNFFTIGPYIVAPEFRGKGFGAIIWDKALAQLENNTEQSILLYAVNAQIHRYTKLGFKQQFINQRWQLEIKTRPNIHQQVQYQQITKEQIDNIVKYDRNIFPAARKAAFIETLKQPNTAGFCVQNKNHVTGFGIIRPCIKGYRIGPLIADTKEIAKCLLSVLVNHVHEEPIIIDMPELNSDGKDLMEFFKFNRQSDSDTVAMLKGATNNVLLDNIHKQYAIFSLEIG